VKVSYHREVHLAPRLPTTLAVALTRAVNVRLGGASLLFAAAVGSWRLAGLAAVFYAALVAWDAVKPE
jgi:hypothetical protein